MGNAAAHEPEGPPRGRIGPGARSAKGSPVPARAAPRAVALMRRIAVELRALVELWLLPLAVAVLPYRAGIACARCSRARCRCTARPAEAGAALGARSCRRRRGRLPPDFRFAQLVDYDATPRRPVLGAHAVAGVPAQATRSAALRRAARTAAGRASTTARACGFWTRWRRRAIRRATCRSGSTVPRRRRRSPTPTRGCASRWSAASPAWRRSSPGALAARSATRSRPARACTDWSTCRCRAGAAEANAALLGHPVLLRRRVRATCVVRPSRTSTSPRSRARSAIGSPRRRRGWHFWHLWCRSGPAQGTSPRRRPAEARELPAVRRGSPTRSRSSRAGSGAADVLELGPPPAFTEHLHARRTVDIVEVGGGDRRRADGSWDGDGALAVAPCRALRWSAR